MGGRPHSEAEKPYDTTLEENMSMYDKLPYKRNEDLCNVSTLGLNSGNLVKFYRCNGSEEAREINNQDELFSQIVSDHLEKEQKRISDLHAHYPILFASQEEQEEFDSSFNEEDYSSDEET